MQRTELTVRAPDGRFLQATVVGPKGGDCVFFLHGTPGVRGLYEPFIETGFRLGLRFVFYSRPGYEGSDRQPGRSVADCAVDIAAIADELRIKPFYVIGESGGGPHALAAAAALPGRVRAVAVIAGPAPFNAEGLDGEGVAELNQDEIDATLAGDKALRTFLEKQISDLSKIKTKRQFLEAFNQLHCAADKAIIRTEFGDSVFANWQWIARQAIWGWFDDDKAYVKGWGFDLDRVTAPVTVWHGDKDLFVPAAHGEWLVNHLPNAEPRFRPDDGHVSIFRHFNAILDDLIASGP